MKKEFIIPIIIIVIVVIVVGYFTLNGITDNSIKVGSAQFDLPEGYHVDNNASKNEVVAITNGTSNLYVSTCEGKYATPHINAYVNSTAGKGQSFSNSTLSVNNLSVYRFFNHNSKATNYWFVYNNHVYTIYSWVDTPNFDGIAIELINSIK